MITSTFTELGNGKLPPLPDSDQNFRLHIGANLVEAQSIDLTFRPSEYDNQVVLGYGQDNHFGFSFELWDFTVRKNLGQENPQTSVCDYADYWLPEKGNFFWVIDNCASDPMSIGTASTLMLAIGDLFNGFDQYCRD